jgi:hypothetical protein
MDEESKCLGLQHGVTRHSGGIPIDLFHKPFSIITIIVIIRSPTDRPLASLSEAQCIKWILSPKLLFLKGIIIFYKVFGTGLSF